MRGGRVEYRPFFFYYLKSGILCSAQESGEPSADSTGKD
jgi:hypothetical protein